jgi:hypothetical protein
MDRTEGGCLCGACRYGATGEPVNVRVCHCRLCQRAIGAAFNARALFRLDQVTLSGPIGRHNSSDAITRGFCTRCGTTVYSAREEAGLIGLTLGSLDDPGRWAPTAHIWVSSRQPWLVLADGLPQYPEGAPP